MCGHDLTTQTSASDRHTTKRVKVLHGLLTSDDHRDGNADGCAVHGEWPDHTTQTVKLPVSPHSPLADAVQQDVTTPLASPAAHKARMLLERVSAAKASVHTSLRKQRPGSAAGESQPAPSTSADAAAVPAFRKYQHLAERTSPHHLPHLDALLRSSADAAKHQPRAGQSVAERVQPMPHQHLVSPALKVPLPDHFETLDQLFSALEYTLLFMAGRDQTALFHTIKKPVENVCGHTFELSHLRRIKHVFPEAYCIDAAKATVQGSKVDSVAIVFNYHWASSDTMVPADASRKRKHLSLHLTDDDDNQDHVDKAAAASQSRAFRHALFASTDIAARAKVFRQRLIDLTWQAHEVRMHADRMSASMCTDHQPSLHSASWLQRDYACRMARHRGTVHLTCTVWLMCLKATCPVHTHLRWTCGAYSSFPFESCTWCDQVSRCRLALSLTGPMQTAGKQVLAPDTMSISEPTCATTNAAAVQEPSVVAGSKISALLERVRGCRTLRWGGTLSGRLTPDLLRRSAKRSGSVPNMPCLGSRRKKCGVEPCCRVCPP